MLCGRYLVNFVVVDIYYNPTGRSVERLKKLLERLKMKKLLEGLLELL